MDHREQLIEFIRLNYDENIDGEIFIKQLLDFMEDIYDESVNEDELTSESSEEEEDDADEEKTSYTVDEDGYHKLD
jgi:lipoate-protein ligase A